MPDAPTPKHGLTQPADDEFINAWPALMRAALGDLDALIAVVNEEDPRPAAGTFGTFHRDADGTISFDTGLGWVTIAQAALSDLSAVPISGIVAYAGSILPPGGAYAWADGSLIDRQVGGVDTTFFTRVQHAYNGGVDPGSLKVRLPDKRGRGSVGAANMGGPAGAVAASNARAAVARGAGGGEVLHLLSAGESGLPNHSHKTHYEYGAAAPNWAGLAYREETARQFDTMLESEGVTGGALAAGSGHNNLQPYEVDHYIVRIA